MGNSTADNTLFSVSAGVSADDEANVISADGQVPLVQVGVGVELGVDGAVVADHATPLPTVGDPGAGQSLPDHSLVTCAHASHLNVIKYR